MIGANRLFQQVKKERGQAMRMFSFPTEERSALIGWGDAALQNRIDGGSTKRSALHMLFREGFAGRGISDVCDQLGGVAEYTECVVVPKCAETRAIVDLEDELCVLRPDEMARLVPGACVTDSKGLYDKNATHGHHSQMQGALCGYRLLGFEGRIGDILSKVFFGYTVERNWVTVLPKDTETEPFASFLRIGQRWRLIFDARVVSSKKRGAAGKSAHYKQQVKRTCLWRDPTPLVLVLRMSASMVQEHRQNILSTSVTLHVSRVNALPTLWLMLSFCLFVATAMAREQVSGNTSPRRLCYKRVSCGEEKRVCHQS